MKTKSCHLLIEAAVWLLLAKDISAFSLSKTLGKAQSTNIMLSRWARHHRQLFGGQSSLDAFRGQHDIITPSNLHRKLHVLQMLPKHRRRQLWNSPTRLLVSRELGSTGEAGIISVVNAQEALVNVDLEKIRQTAIDIRHLLGYDTYTLSISLVDDEEMQAVNQEYRSVDKPTDILSFTFQESERPGILKVPEFDIPDYYHMGDILIDVPYVMRVCDDDMKAAADDLAEDEENDDRGVAPTMEAVSDPEIRLHMLLVHGMLHLVGYDHEEDDDYEAMVTKEDELLRKLNLKKPSLQ